MLFPSCLLFFFNATATTEIYTLSLHDALPIYGGDRGLAVAGGDPVKQQRGDQAAAEGCERQGVDAECEVERSEEHTSELQSRRDLVCRLLLEKKKKKKNRREMI